MTLEDVMARIYDSKDFTAGGGAASAVAAAMAASLVSMVARLSVGKQCGLSDEVYEKTAAEMDEISLLLRDGAVRDLEAFLDMKAAYALPKVTETEKALRREAIGKAAYVAADVPRRNALLALKVEHAARDMKGRSNGNAGSDLEVGAVFARAAVGGCLANIRANLGLIKDPERVAELEAFLQETEMGMETDGVEERKAGKAE